MVKNFYYNIYIRYYELENKWKKPVKPTLPFGQCRQIAENPMRRPGAYQKGTFHICKIWSFIQGWDRLVDSFLATPQLLRHLKRRISIVCSRSVVDLSNCRERMADILQELQDTETSQIQRIFCKECRHKNICSSRYKLTQDFHKLYICTLHSCTILHARLT